MLKRTSLFVCTIVCVFFLHVQVFSQSTTFRSGTAIIDMGSASPTVQNSLKPYGLIYTLLKSNNVPISWVVNTDKVKDGIDFVYNGKSYKGGTFIVSADYISSVVTTVLNSWANQGVIIDYANSSFTVNVTHKINFIPKWVMDRTNGNIAVSFLSAAGIPASAYAFKNPSQLDACDDIFVLPHADPTWLTHSNLLDWNKNMKGSIWAGCHAVSVLENLVDPNDGSRKMNFLSNTGLIPFTDHNSTQTPFTNLLPGDPVAQYIARTDNAQLNGSETVYLPKLGGGWNPGAKILTSSTTQTDVPSLSPGVAVENIYGRAFNDVTRGFVGYQASHNIGGTSAEQVSAQRIFFNFSLVALRDKIPPIISAELTGQPNQLQAGTTSITLTANVTGTGTGLTYQWKSSVEGTFSAANSATTTFTPSSSITSATTCILTCVVTESCGRVSFDSKSIPVIPGTPPLVSADITKSIPDGCTTGSVTFNVFDSNVDANAGIRTLTLVTGLANGTVATTTGGNITFTAVANFKGTTTGTYTISNGGATSTGNISIQVGTSTVAPLLTADAATAVANRLTVINVLSNDKSDANAADGGLLYIRSVSKPSKGNVYINTDGTVSYLSNNAPVVSGGDSFQYLACNTSGYCSATTVTITLVDNCLTGKAQGNDITTPFFATIPATKDSYLDKLAPTVPNGTLGTLSMSLISASAEQRPVIQFTALSGVLSSTLDFISSASLVLTASSAYTNPVLASSNTVNPFPVFVRALNKTWTEAGVTWNTTNGTTAWATAGASTAANDYITTGQQQFAYVSNTSKSAGDTVIANLTAISRNWLTSTVTNNGLILMPTVTKTGTINFYSFDDATVSRRPRIEVSYYPCIVTPTNFIPALYPDSYSTTSVLSVTTTPLLNDVNYYGNVNALLSITQPAHGSASISGNQVIYTPAGNFVGVDTLTYTVRDQTNLTTNTATIRVTVNRVAPTVLDDVASTNSNTAVTINVGANDVDPQSPGTLTAPVITSYTKNGTLTIVGNNIVYTPSTGYVGTDVFQYIRSGLASDVCSVAYSGAATVTVTVNNQPPVANPGVINTFACVAGSISIATIATDPESGVLSATIATPPANGTVVANSEGKMVYTPNTNYVGTDAFTYTVTDPLSATSAAATVSITVSGASNPNTTPIAVNDADNTLVNQPVYTNVLVNDSDPNNDPLSISITALGLTGPLSGTIQLMPNKLVKYTPNTNFSGTDTYQYKLSDTHPGCSGNGSLDAIATVTITVKAIATTLSGTVWNDVDKSAAPGGVTSFVNIKTLTETGTNGSGSLYVYLVDNTNKILDKTPVDVDGTYLLSNVPSLTSNLKLLVSIEDLTIGSSLSTGSVPTGYVNTTPVDRTLPTTTSEDMGPFDWGIYSDPTLSPGTIIGSLTVCGTAIPGTLSSTANATGGSITATGYVYQWQSSITSISTGFTNISGANATSYAPAGSITTTTYFRRKVSTNLDAAVFSNVVTVAFVANPTISISPVVGTIAVGGNIGLTATGGDIYAWSPATGLSSTTTAGVTATPLSTTMYTVTGTLSPSGCVNTSSITITVINPGTIGANQSNCGVFTPAALTSLTNASDASGTAFFSYQWQSSIVSATSGFSNIDAAVSTGYIPSGAITQTTYYKRVATVAAVSVSSNVITAAVNAIPTISILPTSITIQKGFTSTLTASGATSYAWSPQQVYRQQIPPL
jgi:hypothetical protein